MKMKGKTPQETWANPRRNCAWGWFLGEPGFVLLVFKMLAAWRPEHPKVTHLPLHSRASASRRFEKASIADSSNPGSIQHKLPDVSELF